MSDTTVKECLGCDQETDCIWYDGTWMCQECLAKEIKEDKGVTGLPRKQEEEIMRVVAKESFWEQKLMVYKFDLLNKIEHSGSEVEGNKLTPNFISGYNHAKSHFIELIKEL